MNQIFSFDICTSPHDSVKEGVLCTQHMLSEVMADTFQEAELVALQMSYGMTGGMMPTKARIRI